MGQKSAKSFLTIENKTETVFTTHVSDVWDHDWDGVSRPSNNYQGVIIDPNKSATNRAELNFKRGTGRFTMTLNFADGTVDKFTCDQKYAIGRSNPYFEHHIRNHDIAYSRSGSETLVITVRNTQMQINNEKAKQKGKEAEQKTAEKLYAEALKAYDEALSLANDETLKESLEAGKNDVITTMANNSLDEALSLEQKGNELFNEGLALDEKAVEMTENNMANTDIKNKLEEALTKYTEAKSAFERGSEFDKQRFENSLKVVQETISNINESLGNLIKNDLNSKLNDVSIKESVKENVNQNEENILQQIDGAN